MKWNEWIVTGNCHGERLIIHLALSYDVWRMTRGLKRPIHPIQIIGARASGGPGGPLNGLRNKKRKGGKNKKKKKMKMNKKRKEGKKRKEKKRKRKKNLKKTAHSIIWLIIAKKLRGPVFFYSIGARSSSTGPCVWLCKIKLFVKVMILDEEKDCDGRKGGGLGLLMLKICLSVRNPWWNILIAYISDWAHVDIFQFDRQFCQRTKISSWLHFGADLE